MAPRKHSQDSETEEPLRLYEQYAKPLEQQHAGEYVAVTPEGKILIGKDLVALINQAVDEFGPGNHIFKIGERAVGRWVTPRLVSTRSS